MFSHLWICANYVTYYESLLLYRDLLPICEKIFGVSMAGQWMCKSIKYCSVAISKTQLYSRTVYASKMCVAINTIVYTSVHRAFGVSGELIFFII